MKRVDTSPYGDPETAARKLLEIAPATSAMKDGRIYIARVNAPFVKPLNGSKGHPKFGNGIRRAVEQGWLKLHESGTFVRLLTLSQSLPAYRPAIRKLA